MNENESKLRNIIEKNVGLSTPISKISSSDDLTDFGVNSISCIKIMVAIEQEFGIEFDEFNLDFSKFKTINSLSEYIEEVTSSK